MAFFHTEYYEQIKDFLHPHVNSFIDHYRNGNLIELPVCHGCNSVNRNGTREYIDYARGCQCVCPTQKHYWRDTKDKYREKKSFGQDI